ncbi:shikimate dehydrogenase [Pseudalkalibacillus sp. Hm43]|uniref:shikimate dehydrogenase n=1 Tax=Pseudalkalibacillus sp. Hm43 TaxID=3450742 RepID=UPI003F432CA2
MRLSKVNAPFYAVIGDPIEQSMSPAIHNACLQQLGMEARYEAIHVPQVELEKQVERLVEAGCKGFNVTIPHKLRIMDLLDEIDPYARAIGAVNTVEVHGKRLKGYNTDGPGFYRGLSDFHQGNLRDAAVLVLGAGGAARAIVKTLIMKGVPNIAIANRTVSKAKDILEESGGVALSISAAEQRLTEYDIIINTTPIGMYPNEGAMPIDLSSVSSKSTLVDIIYNPLMTEFLRIGLEKGCAVQNGVPMFVHQAALAFEQWTGKEPDIDLMEEIIHQKLGGKPTC